MKIKFKFIISFLVFYVSTSVFAIDGFMHDAFLYMKPAVKDFSEIGIAENVSDGRAVKSSPVDLKKGDIFIDVDGCAKRVTKVTRSGNNITIDTEVPMPYEVFRIIEIPEQTADFMSAVNEKNNITAVSSSLRAVSDEDDSSSSWVDEKLIDSLLSDYDGQVTFELSFPFDGKSKSNMDSLLDEIDSYITAATTDENGDKRTDLTDEEKANVTNLENAKEQVDKRASKIEASPKLSFSPDLRWSTRTDKTNYAFKYAETGIDTHGTWKMWKWTTYYNPGYFEYNWFKDTDFGLDMTVTGGVEVKANVPIPGLAVGSESTGPYAGVYFDFGANAAVDVSYEYYTRTVKYERAFSNFNLVMWPSNENVVSAEWNPSAHQVDIVLD